MLKLRMLRQQSPHLCLVAPRAREVLWSPSQLPIPPFDLFERKGEPITTFIQLKGHVTAKE